MVRLSATCCCLQQHHRCPVADWHHLGSGESALPLPNGCQVGSSRANPFLAKYRRAYAVEHNGIVSCCRNNALPAAAESCKKGTLELNLQSLTVGVAVVSMSHWLLKARRAGNVSPMDVARKLVVVNGLGKHSRAQVCLSGL